MSIATTKFDYSTVSKLEADVARRIAKNILGHESRLAEVVWKMGRELMLARESLKGHFCAWVESEIGWHRSTAHRYIQVAERFTDMSQIATWGRSAVLLLASPSTPESVIDEVKERAANGERITHRIAQEAISTAKQAELAEVIDTLTDDELSPEDDEYEFEPDEASEPEPAPKPAEPNAIGEMFDRYDRFVTELTRGKPPHVLLALKEHSAGVWAAL